MERWLTWLIVVVAALGADVLIALVVLGLIDPRVVAQACVVVGQLLVKQ